MTANDRWFERELYTVALLVAASGKLETRPYTAYSMEFTTFGAHDLSNSYITSTRDVSGLNCDSRGRVAPESVGI